MATGQGLIRRGQQARRRENCGPVTMSNVRTNVIWPEVRANVKKASPSLSPPSLSKVRMEDLIGALGDAWVAPSIRSEILSEGAGLHAADALDCLFLNPPGALPHAPSGSADRLLFGPGLDGE